jgi:hypothetical protein
MGCRLHLGHGRNGACARSTAARAAATVVRMHADVLITIVLAAVAVAILLAAVPIIVRERRRAEPVEPGAS